MASALRLPLPSLRPQFSASILAPSFCAGSSRLHRVAAHILPSRTKFGVRAMAASASPRKITIKRNGDGATEFDAYVLGDEGAPGIVVLQEWWGVDFEIKNHAATIASNGFRTLIPDLYRGKVGLDAAEAQHLMEGLDWQGAVKDVEASVKWLKENGSSKVGVTGFCMGGALTLASAVLIPQLDAAVAFYGVPDAGLADVSKVKIPVQAHFGELDKFAGFSDVGAAKALEEKLKTSGAPSEVHIYSNVGHAFMNASEEAIKRGKNTGFEEFNKDAVDLAWSRFDTWFKKYLST
ncbi:carboxymethylenebutenolidase [Marchantia polymorpha subsp. ruderalis]